LNRRLLDLHEGGPLHFVRRFMASPELTRLLKRILIAAAALCVAVFAYFFYHYTLTGERELDGLASVVLYYGVPLGAAALLLASLRLRPDRQMNLVLVLASFSVALYVGEYLLDYLGQRRALATETITAGRHTEERLEWIARMAAQEGVTFDTRFWYDVVMDLREEGVEAVPVVHRADVLREQPDGSLASRITIDGTEAVPLGGVSNTFTVFCNESGEYVTFTSDVHGFHNPEGMWDLEPLEVGVLGDSYAQGMCVPSDRSFVALIRERVPSTLNLGMAGTGPLIQLAILEEYLRPREPRHVLWFYFEGNDHRDLDAESRSAVLMRYLEGDFRQGLRDRQDALDEALLELVDEAVERGLARREEPEDPWWTPRELFDSLTRPVKLREIRGRLGLLGHASDSAPVEELSADLFRDVVERIVDSVESWGGQLHFVYLPARDRYANLAEFPREEVLAVVREAGIPIVDVHEAFEAHGDPLGLFPFRRMGHYSEEGHRLVAETVMREIRLGEAADVRAADALDLDRQ